MLSSVADHFYLTNVIEVIITPAIMLMLSLFKLYMRNEMSITSLHCRGLLDRCIVTAQAASPTFTHIYAALVVIMNTKFPQIGELIIKRVIVNFKKGYHRNDKVSII